MREEREEEMEGRGKGPSPQKKNPGATGSEVNCP